jgi:hypothetical protein
MQLEAAGHFPHATWSPGVGWGRGERLARAEGEIKRLYQADMAQAALDAETYRPEPEPKPAEPQPEPKPQMTRLLKP